ncbi:MAG: T9SS type A sorting domain-containing protein [Chloroherpetonaceae bacterium]
MKSLLLSSEMTSRVSRKSLFYIYKRSCKISFVSIMKKAIFTFLILILTSQAGFSQWKLCSNGLNDTMAVESIAARDSNVFIGTEWSGIYKSADYGSIWVLSGLLSKIYALSFNGDNIFAGLSMCGLYVSTDNGISWTWEGFSSVIAFANSDNYFFMADAGDLYVSDDSGQSWSRKTFESYGDGYITSITAYGNNIINGMVSYFGPGGVSISTNNGVSWSRNGIADTSFERVDDQIHAVIKGNEYIFAGGSKGVHASTDDGHHWTQKNSGLTSLNVKSLLYWKGYVFAGTAGGGVFLSSDNGDNWMPVNSGLTNLNVNVLGYNEQSFFARPDGGLFRTGINDLVDVQEHITQLHIPIFPNPARDFINTAAYLGGQYQIYDLLGSCFQTGLIDSENINVASLPAGFYTIRFFKEGKQVVEKMMKE